MTKNIQDITTQVPQPQQSEQPQQPQQLDPKQAVQRPVKGKMVQPKFPRENWEKGFSDWLDRFAVSIGKAAFTGIILYALFQLAPDMQEKLPKLYQICVWEAEAVEWIYETVLGFFGSLFRWELGEFLPKVLDGAKELLQGFINLF